MAEELGEYFHTAYLTGKNSIGERICAYNDLQDDRKELEILCTVDILNDVRISTLIQSNGKSIRKIAA